jgi:hypothetical protein
MIKTNNNDNKNREEDVVTLVLKPFERLLFFNQVNVDTEI